MEGTLQQERSSILRYMFLQSERRNIRPLKESVESVEPGTVRDCRDFIKKYEGVENFKIYGNDRYIYQYISEMYPEEEIKFDTTKIKISTIDIEVKSENGFPDVESAAEEVLLITVRTTPLNKFELGVVDIQQQTTECYLQRFQD